MRLEELKIPKPIDIMYMIQSRQYAYMFFALESKDIKPPQFNRDR
jgi:hypothetical protein